MRPSSDDGTADRIAIEHVIWAATAGQRPIDILASIGADWPADAPEPDWHGAVEAVARAWLGLLRPMRVIPGRRSA